MREASPWSPRLAAISGPVSERLIAALAEDIIDGRVPAGARLPAHRALAAALGISIGSVTKAYAALERRGLVRGAQGRGMFAAYRGRDAGGVIDLAANVPPPLLGDDALSDALTAVSRRIDTRGLADYGPPGGHVGHRRSVAAWIALTGLRLEADDLLLCNGAQQAIAAALLAASAARPGPRSSPRSSPSRERSATPSSPATRYRPSPPTGKGCTRHHWTAPWPSGPGPRPSGRSCT